MLKTILLTIIIFTAVALPVNAGPSGNDLCSVFGQLCDVTDTGNIDQESAVEYVFSRASLIIPLLFLGISVTAIFIIIKSGVKYVQSQGNEGQIEEATGAIKNVFIGIAMLFIGFIGIILFLAFFGGTGLLGTESGVNDILDQTPEI